MKKLLTLCIFLMVSQVWAQKIEVSGIVTDESGLPLPGASVQVKNTKKCVTTDFDGKYKLQTNVGVILVFSYVGYATQEVVVSQKTMNIQMKQDGTLDEVVVTAYGGKTNSAKVASAVSTVRVEEALRGSAAGVRVNTGSGQPNLSNRIIIRGQSSIQGVTNMGYHNPQYQTSNESYKEINENTFKRATLTPLSTFSIDVDKAAYSNIRRMINIGATIPADAVKIEEMINYFEYDYKQPKGRHPLAIHTEVGTTPWNKDTKLLKVALKGKEIPLHKIPPSNFTFLIDVSGSMSSQNKLPLLKSAFKLMVDKMRKEDKVAIVVYAGAAGMVLEPTSGDNKEKIIAALDKLNAGGSTAGGAGIELAYKIAAENFIKKGNNRVILATDGDFNVGQTSRDSMKKLIEAKRETGVYLSVLGFGMGNYKDDLLELLADKGNGNHAYIDTMQEAHKIFGKEFGGTLYTIAKDVKLQLEFNPNTVQAYRLIGYENRLLNDEDFKDDTKDAGELGAGHTVTALYEIIPVGVKTEYLKDVDDLKYTSQDIAKKSYSSELLTVKIRYKKPNKKRSIQLKTVVKNKVAKRASDDFNFTAAVALFGMQLRDSEYHNNSKVEDVVALAELGRGEDKNGYRAEFIRLVKSTPMPTK
ncbi:von Willebrand factor type A domain-containing protein [Kordia sp.]|uniref:vWA domain-containing protein n=1 Tax=Kordia sp. TaxID=1965332 RepID=UPI0025BC2149|nr:von Willebrand factor type A domain-containing protein [Kordia sp.]MCH2193991.1 von Willebrand factor type A domain-containing protein [Kordia sp.]